MNACVSVVCYKSKTLSNGENPLMLQVSKGGKRKYQSLGISINPKYWDFTRNKPKPNCPNKEYIQKIILDKQRELQQRMLELNSEQKEYTTTTLLNNENTKFELKTVSMFYKELIEQYTREDKCGNRLIYKGSFNSLKVFTNGKLDIPFNEIDIAWLNKVTTKKWNTEECSNRIDLQRFHLSCRFSPTPPQSLQKPNQDVATLLVRNHTI